MSIRLIDGFEIIPNDSGNILGIESARLNRCIEYAIKNNITKIFIHGGDKYKFSNLDFLKKNNFFTQITVSQGSIDIDLSAIHQLNELKTLNVSNGKQSIDFSFFPKLEELSVDWNNKLKNLAECKTLKRLMVWKYKPKSKSFAELQWLANLKSLEVTQSNIESLTGIENLKKLNNFEGYYLSKIEALDGIESLSKSLKTLTLENCKKLNGFDHNLAKLTSLEKIVLSDCGELTNLNFIKNMPHLKFFSFVGTNVKDGDLSTLKEKKIEFVGFDDRRHYSHKMKEITPAFFNN